MDAKQVWKDVFALARTLDGKSFNASFESRRAKVRTKEMQRALDIAITDRGDPLAAKFNGTVLRMQDLKRRSFTWPSSLNCRCVVRPITEF